MHACCTILDKGDSHHKVGELEELWVQRMSSLGPEAAILVLGLGFIGSAILDTDDYTGRHLGYANSPNPKSESERSIFPIQAHNY